jgi:hypothetical protein
VEYYPFARDIARKEELIKSAEADVAAAAAKKEEVVANDVLARLRRDQAADSVGDIGARVGFMTAFLV